MRVLVTGSNGFVGPWLLGHLRDSGDEPVELPETTDVRDAEGLSEAVRAAAPEAICHLAAQANVRLSWEDPLGTFNVNAVGTLNLCNAATTLSPVPRVLIVSSAEVYGKVPASRMPVREAEPFAPTTPYAASKAAAEMVGLQAWLGRGLPVVVARAFNHTGPGQGPGFVVPDLATQVASVARGQLDRISTGNLDVSRDIIDVRDVVRAYRLLLRGGEPGEAYNVCSGEAVAISEVLQRLMRGAGVDAPVWTDPARMRPVDVPKHVGDRRKITTLTGWAPEIPLDKTLGDVLESLSR
ncbi:MAG TPA: GDP-mannose 4,6-dehydratase [Acidimicrobiales bacterium]|nr:GDP-mannose 4,6-dehydratase [Acidimicrobiales bacterium]